MDKYSNSSSKNIKFFIFGYFGWYNAGDDAIGIAMIRELSRKYPDSEFKVTINDNYFLTKNNLNKKIQSVDFSVLSILKAIKDSNEFIIAGGTHFQDQDEFLIRKIKVFLFFSIIVIYANIIKKPPILLGHGIGSISSTWAKFLLKKILKNSRSIIVRDKDSYNFVKSLGFENKCCIGFDVTAILIDNFNYTYSSKGEDKTLGVSLFPFYSVYTRKKGKDNLIVNTFRKCFITVLNKNPDMKIKLFAFRSGKRHSDEQIIMKLSSQLKEYSNRVMVVVYEGDISHLLFEMCRCYAFIGMRYHSFLFAYLFNKPFIIIDYQKKCESLARDILLPKYATLPLKDIESSILDKKINDMLSNPQKYTPRISAQRTINLAKEMFANM